jgi:serine/threonine-protein kinase
VIGTTIAHYTITEKLGEGGMGEVYRARDTKLNRDVALKILPQVFAQDAQRMARFEREAQVLASLNHPHVAQIHGLEETDGTKALVLELVEGETLRERIARGPIPVDEALKIALQIAEGLEAAHEKGIIHRDLKPANIKITPEGQVKILDFGLAKSLEGETPASDLSNSPTLNHEATQAGVILGTASYMSPEQARGKPVDKRTDIWAFGCVLYEMLTGRKAFAGEDASDTLASILKSEPDWTALPEASLTCYLRTLLNRCLEKDLKRRFRDVGDVAVWIEEVELESPRLGVAPLGYRVSGSVALLFSAVVGAMFGASVFWGLSDSPAQTDDSVMQFEMEPVGETALGRGFPGPPIAVSPDGRFAAFEIGSGSQTSISIRSMDDLEVRPVTGSEGGKGPFFSPDGQWLGFFIEKSIKKVSTQGGGPRSVCDDCLENARGASWSSNDTIVYAPSLDSGIWQVSVDGGIPSPLTEVDFERQESGHRWPQLLPEANVLIFTIGAEGDSANSEIAVQSLDTGESKVLVEGATYGRIISTGHLIYFSEGTMLAVPFDLDRLELRGSPVRLLEGISQNPSSGAPRCDFSSGSVLLYLAQESGKALDDVELTWWDRDGNSVPLPLPPNSYLFPALSPDGASVAFSIASSRSDVWVYEFSNGSLSQFTFVGSNGGPVWSPSGDHLAFYSTRSGPWNLFWKEANFSGAAEHLISSNRSQRPTSFHPSGSWLAFTDVDPITNNGNISLLDLERTTAKPFLDSPSFEGGAMFSPDGKWVAYTSNESGQYEVYVRPFPGSGGQQRISIEGGQQPTWSPDGRELFFLRNDQKTLMGSKLDSNGESLSPRRPERLLILDRYSSVAPPERSNYLVSLDGQGFLVSQDYDPERIRTPIRVILNWQATLERPVPPE